VAEARWRLALGVAQMSLSMAAAVALVRGEALVVVAILAAAATAATAASVARWGVFWRRR
jgi:hypothetical protein